MNAKFKSFTYLGILLFIPMVTLAASGWTAYAPIAELRPTIHGRFLVNIEVPKNPSGCRIKGMFYQDYNVPGAKQMFHTLLEAVSSNKPVRVYVTGRCELNGYSEISSIGIVP